MGGKSFHKLFGFQGIRTNVMWEGKRHHGSEECEEEEWHREEEDKELGGMSQYKQQANTSDCNCQALSALCMARYSYDAHKHADSHKRTIRGMLTATVPAVLRGNLKNGTVRNFRYLKQSFTFLLVKELKLLLFCEHLRLIHQPTLCVLNQCFD